MKIKKKTKVNTIDILFLHELLHHEIFELDEHNLLMIVEHHVDDDLYPSK